MPPHASGMPSSTSGIEKRAERAATRRSHTAASTSPPPTHQPRTLAMATARSSSIARAIRQPLSASSRGVLARTFGAPERGHVGAGGERPPLPRHDDDLQVVVLVEPPRRLLDLVQRVRRQRIEFVRTGQCQRADGTCRHSPRSCRSPSTHGTPDGGGGYRGARRPRGAHGDARTDHRRQPAHRPLRRRLLRRAVAHRGARRAAQPGGPDGAVDARRQPDEVAPGPHHLVLRDVPARSASRRTTARSTDAYRVLFNSYYEAVGPRHPRAQRGADHPARR